MPTGNESPGLCDEINETPAQLSDAVGAIQVATAAHVPAAAVSVMFAGTPAMVGFSASVTVTVNDAMAVLLEASVAV